MKKANFYIVYMLLLAGVSSASEAIDVSSDFYTPMSHMVFSGRDYLLTSNAQTFMNAGEGRQSYETLLFLKFDSALLPADDVDRAWIRMASGGPEISMGEMTRPTLISAHPVDLDVMNILNGTMTPRQFYVEANHILDSIDGIMVYEDGVCYWDVTGLVNQWIAYNRTGGLEGVENLGFAITGRDDYGANDPNDNQIVEFWSKQSVEGVSGMPHAVMPVLIFTDGQSGFGDPWIPDWRSSVAHTHQQWLFSAANGRCEQPFLPDGYCFNAFGNPNVIWQEDEPAVQNPFMTWHPFVDLVDPNGQPVWVDGVYGAPYRSFAYGEHTLQANVPTGSQSGSLQVFVQFDWYNGGEVEVAVPGAADVTPSAYANYEIGQGENGYAWYRSTKVFEYTVNPGQIAVELTISGGEPYVDSLSVTTAVNASVPDTPLRNVQDVNLDGYVNLIDFSNLSQQWQPGTIGMDELLALVEQWLDISDYVFPL